MDFSTFLISKKIDEKAFFEAEPSLFKTWRDEFEQMHPNSFTVQKLNLINPIRRKYQLKEDDSNAKSVAAPTSSPTPRMGKPVIPSKPKIS